MPKFLIAVVAVVGFATSAFADVKTCDTMWIQCVNNASRVGRAYEYSFSLACDRQVVQCRTTGQWAGQPVVKLTKDIGDRAGAPKGSKPTNMTAGTAGQRASGTIGGTTAGVLNPNVGSGGAPTSAPSSSTGAASGAPVTPTKIVTGINKPPATPTQLADRLRRLQQQRQF
jgi:hypothetical protein